METSARGEIWWTERTTPDKATGPNRESLAGLDVEKLRGDDAPLGPEMSIRWVMVRENFEIALIVIRNRWCRSVILFYNVTSPSETLLSEENRDFRKNDEFSRFLSVFFGWSTSTL